MGLAAIAWGFLGGVFGWAITTFIAQPLAAVMAARSEAAQVLAQFEVCDCFNSLDEDGPTPPSDAMLSARAQAYANTGAKLAGFDLSYQPLARVLRFRFVNWRPKQAGDALLLLAQMRPGNFGQIEFVRQNALRALRLGYRFGKTERTT